MTIFCSRCCVACWSVSSAVSASFICRDLMIFSVTAAAPPVTPEAKPRLVPASRTGRAAPAEAIVSAPPEGQNKEGHHTVISNAP